MTWTKAQRQRYKATREDKHRHYLVDRERHLPRILITSARVRATKRGTPISLIPDDVTVPDRCPVFGFKLVAGKGKMLPTSPTLDEIIPGKGYVPGNIQVLSGKANTMKSNATPKELRQFARWIRRTYGE